MFNGKNKALTFSYDDGHEVAVHTLTHPNLLEETDDEVIRQVEEDRIKLSELTGYEVKGMAYPFGFNYDRTAKLIENHTGVKYARVVETTGNFDIDEDLYRFRGTIYHHPDWNNLFDIGKIYF